MFTLSIIHCSDRDFMERFREDLASSVEQVLILSPFISENRTSHYYPVFRALSARSVSVVVFAKPIGEQPNSLRDHFSAVERQLIQSGVTLRTRPGMHEKMAVVDAKVLWHGSLNILSHNNTFESMLRFDSPDLVTEVLTDLGLSSYSQGQPARSTELTSPGTVSQEQRCPECGRPMILYNDASMWICCSSPGCSGAVSVEGTLPAARGDVAAKRRRDIGLVCPICNSLMAIVYGITRRIECSNIECAFSLDRRVSTGLIRVLKRHGII